VRDAWNLIDEEEEGEKILVCQYGIPITVRSFSTIHDQPLKGSNAGWLNDEVWHPWSMDFVTFTIMTIKKFCFHISHDRFWFTLCRILQIQSCLPDFKDLGNIHNRYCCAPMHIANLIAKQRYRWKLAKSQFLPVFWINLNIALGNAIWHKKNIIRKWIIELGFCMTLNRSQRPLSAKWLYMIFMIVMIVIRIQ